MALRDQPDADLRRRATGKETTRRQMTFQTPAAQRLAAPVPEPQQQQRPRKQQQPQTPDGSFGPQASTPMSAISSGTGAIAPSAARIEQARAQKKAAMPPPASQKPAAPASVFQSTPLSASSASAGAPSRAFGIAAVTPSFPTPINVPVRSSPMEQSKRSKQKRRADEDEEDEEEYRGEAEIRLVEVGPQARRLSSATDLDVVLGIVEDVVADVARESNSRAVRSSLGEFLQETRLSLIDMIEMSQEQRLLKSAVRVANTKKRKLRQQLLDTQRSRWIMEKRVAELKKKYTLVERERTATAKANEFLKSLEEVRRKAMASKRQPAGKSATAPPPSTTTAALLLDFDALARSAPSLRQTNALLEDAVQALSGSSR